MVGLVCRISIIEPYNAKCTFWPSLGGTGGLKKVIYIVKILELGALNLGDVLNEFFFRL